MIDYARVLNDQPAPLMILNRDLCFIYANDAYLRMVGRDRSGLMGRYVFDLFPESDERQRIIQNAFEIAAKGEPNEIVRLPYSIAASPGSSEMVEKWWECQHSPAIGKDGEIVGVIQQAFDITAEVASEEMQLLLSQELNHRVKNLFAIVQALVVMSAQGETDAAALAEKIRNRVSALAAAHSVTAEQGEMSDVSMREIIRQVLAPYDGAQTEIDEASPSIKIDRSAVTPIGLILHELATNALKYGGWSVPGGKVEITWQFSQKPDEEGMIAFAWRESGLPGSASADRQKSGFGSRLMTNSARQLGGNLEQIWGEDGLETRFSFTANPVRG